MIIKNNSKIRSEAASDYVVPGFLLLLGLWRAVAFSWSVMELFPGVTRMV